MNGGGDTPSPTPSPTLIGVTYEGTGITGVNDWPTEDTTISASTILVKFVGTDLSSDNLVLQRQKTDDSWQNISITFESDTNASGGGSLYNIKAVRILLNGVQYGGLLNITSNS